MVVVCVGGGARVCVFVCECACAHLPATPAKRIPKRAIRMTFHSFRYIFGSRPFILILLRLEESSGHSDPKSISFLVKIFFLGPKKWL